MTRIEAQSIVDQYPEARRVLGLSKQGAPKKMLRLTQVGQPDRVVSRMGFHREFGQYAYTLVNQSFRAMQAVGQPEKAVYRGITITPDLTPGETPATLPT